MGYVKFLSLLLLLVIACNKDNARPTTSSSMYFPPNTGAAWETTSIQSLGWNENALQPLMDYLDSSHAKSFIILVNGRIVIEKYFNGQTASDSWAWNSAGKTLVSASIGIAQQEGLLDVNDKVSKYLGTGWSAEPTEKENLITIRHLLTMTSGLDDSRELVIKSNLTYVADAGSRWAYANVFQLLMDVIARASGQTFKDYFQEKIGSKTGMDGFWNNGIIFRIYHSNARSMARFGLLALNHGKWKDIELINGEFFKQSISASQNINPAYGYFWWLNGKQSYMLPGRQQTFYGPLISAAPSEMYAAMGANDQRIYVVPGQQMVVVRMGETSDPDNPSFAVSGFDNALWQKINALIR